MSPKCMEMVTEFQIKIPKYECENCDIKTNNKKDFEKHILTAKHMKLVSGDNFGDKGDKQIKLALAFT